MSSRLQEKEIAVSIPLELLPDTGLDLLISKLEQLSCDETGIAGTVAIDVV